MAKEGHYILASGACNTLHFCARLACAAHAAAGGGMLISQP